MSTSKPDPKSHLDRMEPRSKPDVELMLREIRDAVNGANALGVFKKLEVCHHTRNCWWQNQQDDGRKPAPQRGTRDNLYHWEGAPETRRHKADEIVLERAGLRELVLHRGLVSVQAPLAAMDTDEPDGGAANAEQIEEAQLVVDHFRRAASRPITYAWKLFSTCVEEFGYGALYADFQREIRNDKKTVKQDDFLQFIASQIVTDTYGPDFDVSQMTEQQMQWVQSQTQLVWALIATGDAETRGLGESYLMSYDPAMTQSEARLCLKEMVDEGEGSYFVPMEGDGLLIPMALIPWVNLIHPASLTGGGRADWFAIPEWVSGPTLQSAGRDYDKAWVKKVLDYPNKTMPELLSVSLENLYAWVLNGAGIGLHIDQNYVQQETPVYLILHVWRVAVDKEGRPTVFRTVLHPLVNDAVGLHEGTGLSQIPLLIDTAEPVNHAMLSRGVGEIVVAAQNQVMDLMDSEGARAQLGSNPPLRRSQNEHIPVRPGMQMFVRSAGVKDATGFMETPKVDEGSLKLIEIAEDFVDKRFFRSAQTDPDTKQQQRELLAYAAMQSLGDFWQMLYQVIRANVRTLNGQPVNLMGTTDIQIAFNVAGLGADTSDAWMKTITDLMTIDPGVIDRGEAVRDIVMMKNPAMAHRLVMSSEKAAEQIRGDQQLRISKIMNGWKPQAQDYPERQTNPQMRLGEMDAYLNDPWNQQRLSDPRNGDALQIMQQERKYLQDQVTQYTTNVQTGRSLVSPKTPQEMAG